MNSMLFKYTYSLLIPTLWIATYATSVQYPIHIPFTGAGKWWNVFSCLMCHAKGSHLMVNLLLFCSNAPFFEYTVFTANALLVSIFVASLSAMHCIHHTSRRNAIYAVFFNRTRTYPALYEHSSVRVHLSASKGKRATLDCSSDADSTVLRSILALI